jgi:hypothetical protein
LIKLVVGFAAAFTVTATVTNGYLTLLNVRKGWQETGSPGLAINGVNIYSNFNLPPFANSYRAFFSPITDSSSVLIVDRPHIIRNVTGLTCVARPDKLSVADLQKLTELPPRSYMVVPNSELPKVLDSFKQYDIALKVTPTDGITLIHLPITLNSAKLPSS